MFKNFLNHSKSEGGGNEAVINTIVTTIEDNFITLFGHANKSESLKALKDIKVFLSNYKPDNTDNSYRDVSPVADVNSTYVEQQPNDGSYLQVLSNDGQGSPNESVKAVQGGGNPKPHRKKTRKILKKQKRSKKLKKSQKH